MSCFDVNLWLDSAYIVWAETLDTLYFIAFYYVDTIPACSIMADSNNGLSEKAKVTNSSILIWEIPGTKEPGGLQSMGLRKSKTT